MSQPLTTLTEISRRRCENCERVDIGNSRCFYNLWRSHYGGHLLDPRIDPSSSSYLYLRDVTDILGHISYLQAPNGDIGGSVLACVCPYFTLRSRTQD